MRQKLLDVSNKNLADYLIDEAIETILALDALTEFLRLPDTPTFLEKHLPKLLDNGPDLPNIHQEIIEHDEWMEMGGNVADKERLNRYIFLNVTMALHLGVRALQATTNQKSCKSHTDATLWRGHAQGILWGGDKNYSRAEFSRKGAFAANAEDAAMERKVQAWYAQNGHMYKSVAAAARAIVKIEPIPSRSAEIYITRYKKTQKKA